MSIDTESRPYAAGAAVTNTAVGLAATGVAFSAAIHFDLWQQGVRQVHVVGALFLLNAIGGAVIAVAMVAWRHWLTALAASGFGATTVIFFWISVEYGLFGVHASAGGAQAIVAQVAEYAAVLFGLLAAGRFAASTRSRRAAARPSADHDDTTMGTADTSTGALSTADSPAV